MDCKNKPEYIIEDISLRERLLDRSYAEKWCNENMDNPEVVSFLRMLGRIEEAILLGRSFISEKDNSLKKQYAILRLAVVYQWNKEDDLAQTSFLSVIKYATINNDQRLLSFAYQHLGKFYFEKRDFYKARFYGLKALEIRKRHWSEYVKSSEQLVEACRVVEGDFDEEDN